MLIYVRGKHMDYVHWLSRSKYSWSILQTNLKSHKASPYEVLLSAENKVKRRNFNSCDLTPTTKCDPQRWTLFAIGRICISWNSTYSAPERRSSTADYFSAKNSCWQWTKLNTGGGPVTSILRLNNFSY